MNGLFVNSSVMSSLVSLFVILSLKFGIQFQACFGDTHDDSPTKEPTEEPIIGNNGNVTLEILFNGEGGKQDLSIDINLDDIDCEFKSGIKVFEQACLGLGINFVTTFYSQYSGYFIDSIDGIEDNSVTNFYWFLYVDDYFSDVGISKVDASLYNTITWSFEEWIVNHT